MTGAGGVVGIVLAGGRSSRFSAAGLQPGPGRATSKLDADLAGRSVLDRAIAALAEVSDEVVVVGRPDPAGQPHSAGPQPHVSYIEDRDPFGGPVAGLRDGLAASTRDVAVVAAGDMPLLRSAVLLLLAGRLASGTAIDAALLAVGDQPQPLPLAVRRTAALVAAVEGLAAGDRSLRGLVERLRHEDLPEVRWRALDPGADTLFDVDTPADLEESRRRLG